ncbi:MAG: photosynthetic complex putative assembly protein PuhB [Pseudomonadota bacterium]
MSFRRDNDGQVIEPFKGLPEDLPEGEKVLWQGKPNALALAFQAFHLRLIIGYFAVMTVWRLVSKTSTAEVAAGELASIAVTSAAICALSLLLLYGLAALMANSTVYTLTTRRVVLRYGVAIRKYVNMPFTGIKSVSIQKNGNGVGNLSLLAMRPAPVPYLHLWPHVRPLRLANAEPMLRAVDGVEAVGARLAAAMKNHLPETVAVTDNIKTQPAKTPLQATQEAAA